MKFNEELALSVYRNKTIPDEKKISAIGFIYLASDILGKEIPDLDKCYYADAKKCFDKLLPIDDKKCLLVRNRYGLDNKKPLSLEELSSMSKFEISCQRHIILAQRAMKK